MSTLTPTSDQVQLQNCTAFQVGDTVRSTVDDRTGTVVTPDNFVPTVQTGTVAIVNFSNVVVGTGTMFTKEVSVGDSIWIGSWPVQFFVLSIADDLNLMLTQAYFGPTTSSSPYLVPKPSGTPITPTATPTPSPTQYVKVMWQDQTTSLASISTILLVARGAY